MDDPVHVLPRSDPDPSPSEAPCGGLTLERALNSGGALLHTVVRSFCLSGLAHLRGRRARCKYPHLIPHPRHNAVAPLRREVRPDCAIVGEHQKAGGDSSVRVSLTHRLWADAPGQGSDAGRQELARLRLSQQFNPSGQEEHAFKRLAPDPLWADLLLEAQVAPVSLLHVSTAAACNPVETQLVRATAELKLQPLSFWTLSLAPEFA